MEGNQYTEQEFENIENYLMDRMTPVEKSSFEERMTESETLRAKVEELRELITGIEAFAIKNLMDDFHEDMQKSRPADDTDNGKNNTRPFWMPYLIAASLLIFISLLTLWYFQSTPAHEVLFARHFVPDPGLITPMSAEDNFLFYSGMVDYKTGDFASALRKWNELATQSLPSDTLAYFLGVAYLAEHNAVKAILWLEKVKHDQESVFMDDLWFYLGLAHLKMGDTEEAKAILARSSQPEAKALLEDLK